MQKFTTKKSSFKHEQLFEWLFSKSAKMASANASRINLHFQSTDSEKFESALHPSSHDPIF